MCKSKGVGRKEKKQEKHVFERTKYLCCRTRLSLFFVVDSYLFSFVQHKVEGRGGGGVT